MAEIVNLRQARKAKARSVAESRAAANRAGFGRTKSEKLRQAAEKAMHERALRGALRDSRGGDGSDEPPSSRG